MKKYFFYLPLLILFVGCDAPQRTLAPSQYSGSLTNAYNGFPTTGTTGGTTLPTTGGTTSGVPSNPVTATPGFENCDISDRYYTVDIGHFGICQSSTDETLFKFRTSLASTSVRTCLIPLYKDASGSSTYVGNPQCTYTQANTVVTGKLVKDRSGFSGYVINGVMVMKEPLTPQYYSCMQAYVNWPRNACPNGPTTSYCAYYYRLCPSGGAGVPGPCDAEAKNYMNNICTSFKNTYANSYADIRTK